MEDWRSSQARIKGALRRGVLWGAARSGRLIQQTPEDLAVRPEDSVPFFGHRVRQEGGLAPHRETRLSFAHERPAYERVSGLAYSPTGKGWVGGQLVEKYSVSPIRLEELRARPPAAPERVQAGVVVECDSAYSYGDWTHCYLGTLLSVDFPDLPVFIPHHLAQKSYVRRDLEGAGVNWITAEGWVEIEEACVLRKPNPLTYWTPHDVAAYRDAFGIRPAPPVPGSVSYLGRFGFQGEVHARQFPSELAATAVRAMGGTIVSQGDLNTGTAHRFADEAETVIGDHGSGMLNIMFWRPKTVIELFVDNYWVNNTLFVAAAMGVQNMAVLRVDDLSAAEIETLITRCLEYFAETPDGQA